MLKIDRISIRNYKNLIAEELTLNNFNIVIGPNNSGKSNFIQIISFLNHIINGSIDEVKNELRNSYFSDFGLIIPFNSPDKGEILIEIQFSETEKKLQYRYRLILGWKSQKKSAIPKSELFFKSEEFDFKNIHKTGPATSIFKRAGNSIVFGKGLKKIGQAELPDTVSVISLLKVLSKQFADDEITIALKSLDSILKTETIYFSNIELAKTGKSRVEKFLGRTVSFNIIDEIVNIWREKGDFEYFNEVLSTILSIDYVHVIEFGQKEDDAAGKAEKDYFILFKHLGSNKQLWELSDGSILLIALVTKIIISKSEIFLIEEPENSLHPKALIDLINFMRSYENERQFIISSHSIALINSMGAEDVIISKCSKDGTSELLRVENLVEMRKLLKRGFLAFSDILFFNAEEII